MTTNNFVAEVNFVAQMECMETLLADAYLNTLDVGENGNWSCKEKIKDNTSIYIYIYIYIYICMYIYIYMYID